MGCHRIELALKGLQLVCAEVPLKHLQAGAIPRSLGVGLPDAQGPLKPLPLRLLWPLDGTSFAGSPWRLQCARACSGSRKKVH